ncbi:MAG: hypothetical protein ACJ71G_07480 [Nitrososphaeraceae archaeon]
MNGVSGSNNNNKNEKTKIFYGTEEATNAVFFHIRSNEITQEKSYLQSCKTNHFGYGANSSISNKTLELMETAVLTTLLAYLKKMEMISRFTTMSN